MKIISPFELYNCDYSLSETNALKQYWTRNDTFTCIGKPKSCNMLLYLDGFIAEYTFKDGEKTYAESNSIVYTPTKSEYSVRFFNPNSKDSNTIGVNFSIYDSQNNPFVLNDRITVYNADNVNF